MPTETDSITTEMGAGKRSAKPYSLPCVSEVMPRAVEP